MISIKNNKSQILNKPYFTVDNKLSEKLDNI